MEIIIERWNDLIGDILALEPFDFKELQDLLKETYLILRKYHKDELIPKEVAQIFIAMEEVFYFASALEDEKINNYYSTYLHSIMMALKEGFFDGEYPCAYPRLSILDLYDHEIIIDFDKNIFEEESL